MISLADSKEMWNFMGNTFDFTARSSGKVRFISGYLLIYLPCQLTVLVVYYYFLTTFTKA